MVDYVVKVIISKYAAQPNLLWMKLIDWVIDAHYA